MGNALKRVMPEWKKDILIEQTRTLRESPGKHPDVFIVHNSINPVAIETSADRGNADMDAKARLGTHYTKNDREIHTAIAVELTPKDLTRSKINAHHIMSYAIHQTNRRFPKTGFIQGNVHDLIRVIRATGITKEDLDEAATFVAQKVMAAANILELKMGSKDLLEISHTLYQRSALTGLQTTMILWLNALLVQQRMYGGVYDIPKITETPSECLNAWEIIYGINWRAIFKPAINILKRCSVVAPAEVSECLGLLKKAVERIEMTQGISIGAELFPKVAEDRDESAAFYTQPATAELLAALTITPDMEDWSDDIFKRFRIADITCGTGTLLRYGYFQVKQHHFTLHGGKHLQKLHKDAMEYGLLGTDVSPIASHLTSTGLAVDTKQPYGDTNIGWVGVGNEDRTGGIEYIATNTVSDLMMDTVGHSTGYDDKEGYNSVVIKDKSIDVILMNPPYSRTRGGQSAFNIAGLTDQERLLCQNKWGKLIKNEPCVKTAGMAATFLCVARKKVKPGGRIGFVLPKSAAFDHAWRKTRSMVECDFIDIVAISVSTGKARNKTGLSADTAFEEMLLVATRKRTDDGKTSPVRCVTLHEPPARLGEAAEIAKAIMTAPDDGPVILGSDVGISIMFDAGDGRPWSSVGVMHDSMDSFTNNLVSGKIKTMDDVLVADVPMTVIEKLLDVGPTHDLIGHPADGDGRGAFTFHRVADGVSASGKYRSLWRSDATKQKSLLVNPTHRGVIHDKIKATKVWKQRSTLFLQRGMQWTSQSVLAASTKHPVMGGRAWVALLHDDPVILKAFAIWANSIYGMTAYWSQGSRTQLGRSMKQVKGIRMMPCPDLNSIPRSRLDDAACAFDELSTMSLMPAWEADRDPIRAKINTAASRLLGAPDYDTDTITEMWCAEPSVRHNKRPPD